MYRYNQELEEDTAAMEQERVQLQQQAETLARRLEAVLSDQMPVRDAFDAETPIDKTMSFLQDIVKVSFASTIFLPYPRMLFVSQPQSMWLALKPHNHSLFLNGLSWHGDMLVYHMC